MMSDSAKRIQVPEIAPATSEAFFMPFLFGGDSSGDASESQAERLEQTDVRARNNEKQ